LNAAGLAGNPGVVSRRTWEEKLWEFCSGRVSMSGLVRDASERTRIVAWADPGAGLPEGNAGDPELQERSRGVLPLWRSIRLCGQRLDNEQDADAAVWATAQRPTGEGQIEFAPVAARAGQ